MNFLCELAKEMPEEIMGYKRYHELAEMTDNENERQKLMEIAEHEKKHYMIIKDIIESYM